MSKLNIYVNGKVIDEFENNTIDFNKKFVVVERKYIDQLNDLNIRHFDFTREYFLVKRGRKKKRFNKDQQQEILSDLQSGLSIKKCSEKYKCSTRTIQIIKKGNY